MTNGSVGGKTEAVFRFTAYAAVSAQGAEGSFLVLTQINVCVYASVWIKALATLEDNAMPPIPDAALFLPKTGLFDLADQMRTYLVGSKMRLLKDAVAVNADTVVADLTPHEATYAGYPAGGQVVVWGATALDADGRGTLMGTRLLWRATDAVTPNNITGGWIESAGGVLEMTFTLAIPAPLDDALHFLATTPIFQVSPAGDGFYGLVDVEN